MKVLIITDMEGCAGIFHRELQISNPTQQEFSRSLRFATGEVNAAIEGAKAAKAEDIWVYALHDIDMEMLPEGIQIIRGTLLWDTVFKEEDFDALILIGQHGGAHQINSALSHTCLPSWQIEEPMDSQQGWVSQIAPQLTNIRSGEFSTVRNVWLDGALVGESGLLMSIAAGYGVPTICLAGDSHACEEAKELVPEIVSIPVKWGYHFRAARMLSPFESRKQIREGVVFAFSKLNQIPLIRDRSKSIRVQYVHPERADRVQRLTAADRVDDFTVSITVPSGQALSSIIAALFARPVDALSEPTFTERQFINKLKEQST